jgi:hypothetical protein
MTGERTMTSCDRYRIDAGSAGRVVARCSCGWRSAGVLSAGLAGGYWDEHRARTLDVRFTSGRRRSRAI